MLPKDLPKLQKWCREADPGRAPPLAAQGRDQDQDRDAVITLGRLCHPAADIWVIEKTLTPASALASLG